jgi:hypothetical protein
MEVRFFDANLLINSGALYIGTGTGDVWQLDKFGLAAIILSGLDNPAGVAFSNGTLFVAETTLLSAFPNIGNILWLPFLSQSYRKTSFLKKKNQQIHKPKAMNQQKHPTFLVVWKTSVLTCAFQPS